MEHFRRVRPLSFRVVALATAITLGGCSTIVNPGLPPRKMSARPGPENTLFAAKVEEANTLLDALQVRRENLEIYDYLTGYGLLGVGLAGMAFGFFDAPRTALLAAGVAGGAIVGVRSFVPWQERKDVYAMGEEAIVCAVTALSFGTVDKTTEESSGATGATPQPVAGGASSAAAPLGHEAVRLRSLSTNLLSLAGTVDPRPGEPQPVAADLTGRIEKQTDLTPQLKSMAARASARGPAEAFLVNRLVIRYEDLKTSLVKASASVAAVETTISHADVERADRLDKALAAIRSAINSQVNGLGFQPNLALQAAGDHVNPYLQRIAGQIGEARAAVRQADTRGKETTSSANAVAGTVAQGGEAGVVEEAAAIGQKTQQQAAQGSSILRSTLSIISVPSACGGGLVAPAPDTSAEDNGEGDS